MDDKAMFESLFHKVRLIEKSSGEPIEHIGKVIVYESKYDSGCDESCLWLDNCQTIFPQSDIMLLQIID